MSNASETPHKDGGNVTWRWLVMISLTILGTLSLRVLNQIEKTADIAASMQVIVSTMNSRIDAHVGRLDGHDRRIGKLEDWRFTSPSRGTP